MAHTKPFTIENLHGAVRLTKKLTLLDLKQGRVNLAPTLSSAPIAKVIIKPIPLIVLSGSTVSTRNSIVKNMPRSEKIAKSQFILLGTPPKYDLQEHQNLLSKHLEKLLINTILEVKSDFDIIFIQEPSWSSIRSIPSSSNCKGDILVSVVNHPNWLTFVRSNTNDSDPPRVVTYINIRLSSLCLSI